MFPPDRAAAVQSSVLSGGGEMGALMRSIDWSKTAVGPVQSWPQSLRTALSILLETGFPMYIAWGRDFTQFYNDGYRPILGSTKHPQAMGISTRETFAEIWNIIGPMFEGVMDGKRTDVVDFLLPLDRHGFAEECYFIFSYSPIREEAGSVGGVLVTVTETTQRVLGERRLKTTQALAAETRQARTVHEACAIAGGVLEKNRADLPFACVYLIDADAQVARSVVCSGGACLPAELADTIELDDGYLARALLAGEPQEIELVGMTAELGKVLALPSTLQGSAGPTAVLVAGTSGRLMLDAAYRNFLSLVASQIGTAIAGAQMLEQARARADELARLDRAKTAFFSNVSHEFRTPLTLMLGPTQEALASPERALSGEDLETVYRNQLRLLKLVNTLLEFSRIEAGRVDARFEPTDLGALTADLASAFRSATARAGLAFEVDCRPIGEAVHVDPEMWEKIVLNLISNAFKFTLEGSIRVELEAEGQHVELRVRDTGVGIAPGDLGRIFERFHQAPRAAARTHEGSGIGLALVQELVAIHGGTIQATSELGRGTEFVVRIPRGTAHLPRDRVVAAGAARVPAARMVDGAAPFVEEALRWLPNGAPSAAPGPVSSGPARSHILIADDNADMRDYLVRLLAARFHVHAVSTGDAALLAAIERRPDVVVSDVMMPGLDGFQLVAALRQREETRTLPVILLSARAGHEASVDGLRAGADDYLVKPFSARELMARIDGQLMRSKLRDLEKAHAREIADVFAHAPVGVAFLGGPEHRFEFANERYLDLVAGRPLLGKPIREALPELEGQGIYELLDQVYSSGKPHIGRSLGLVIQRRGGSAEQMFFDFTYQPLLDDRGQTRGITVVVVDVTELTLARRQSDAAHRAKDEFLAMLGHELRNPLAPIVTALQLMQLRGVVGADRERTVIERQVKHLMTLVDDLLDVSRIARGKVQLERRRLDFADVTARAIEMVSPAIDERGHVLTVHIPRGLVVDGDEARLAQVLANLLTNAAKYTDPRGQLRISAQAEGSVLRATVSDNGRGIDPGILPHVFELFSQEQQEIDRSRGGLGLGLAIVKSLVEAHGGRVQASSEGKGRGAEFSVYIPLAELRTNDIPVTAAEIPLSAAKDGQRILVVDDNIDAAELLAASLCALGHTAHVVFDGPSALQAAAEFKADVVLLDLGLPVMDGYEVARSLRSAPQSEKVALIAVTGYGQEGDRQRTREAGFDAHLVKPIDLAQLNGWLQRRRDAAAHSPVVAGLEGGSR
jgi:signal transduction histidine kinase/DNA-binding response OmpR family regulator